MPIRLACRCGQRLTAPDKLAGKKAKCPHCGQLIAVPAPAPARAGPTSDMGRLLDEVGVKASKTGIRCPECGADMAPEAVLCVQCGYRLDLKRKITPVVELEDHEEDDETARLAASLPKHEHELLNKAELDLLLRKKQDEMLQKGLPWWVYAFVFALLVFFIVGMMGATPLDRREVMQYMGWAIVGIGAVASLGYNLALVVRAFQTSRKTGLLYLFVPGYAAYYVIKRWKWCRLLVIRVLQSLVMVGVGCVFFWLATVVPR